MTFRNGAFAVSCVIAVAVAALGTHDSLGLVSKETPRSVFVSDFDRNIIGLDALRMGSPTVYVQLSNGDPDLQSPMDQWWVAHTPVAIAIASLSRATFGELAGNAFRLLTACGWLAMSVMIIRWGCERRWPACWLVSGALLTWTYPARLDVAFAQGQSLAAIGALLAILLCSKRSRTGTIASGILGAYRPWYIPFVVAYVEPKSIRMLGIFGLSIVGSTALALPLVGGPRALWWFLEVANPANNAQQLENSGNLAVLAGLDGGLLLGVAAVVGLIIAYWTSPSLRIGAIGLLMLAYPPLLWAHGVGAVAVLVARLSTDTKISAGGFLACTVAWVSVARMNGGLVPTFVLVMSWFAALVMEAMRGVSGPADRPRPI